MRTQKDVSKEIKDLAIEVRELAEEVRLHEYCSANGLNYHNASDYAIAISGLMRERRDNGEGDEELRNQRDYNCGLRKSNTIDGQDFSSYHQDNTEATVSCIIDRIDEISRYGWIGKLGDLWNRKWDRVREKGRDLWEDTKSGVKRATGTRRNIRNNSDENMWVTGNMEDESKKLIVVQRKGGNSSPALYDADGVVIQSGQKFYLNEKEMKGNGKVYENGVIKVGDAYFGWGNAEICNVPDKRGYFYVNASNTEYYSLNEAEKHGWKVR